MPELLWEIGCEELPATFVAPTLAQIEETFREKSTLAKILDSNGSVKVYGTPRRLVLHVTGLAEAQPDETVSVKGPAQNIAFDAEGKPTKAAMGFAQKNKIAVEELQVVDGYVQATVKNIGRPSIDILSELLPKIARELAFPKAMRWGVGKLRFARPIRWIVALLDNEIIPFSIEHVATGRNTRGHRFLAPQEAEVPNPAAYFDIIRSLSVLIDPEERKQIIVKQSEELAKSVDGAVQIDPALLDENVHLTEYPTAVMGGFDPGFLELPKPVLVTAMRKHQRYFPLNDKDGNLMPRFIAVRNGGNRSLDLVQAGYEHVLVARFNDARFFFEIDTAITLESKIEGTKNIVFQEKLGSVYQKTQRLTEFVEKSGLLGGLNDEESAALKRGAYLSKADLSSEMVKELPALQGVVGSEYAQRDGEAPLVVKAIYEHYMPKGAGDAIPVSIVGRLLAIADRIDTLTGYLGLGIVPSGTSDPFALRRAASGLVALMSANANLPSLHQLFETAWNSYVSQNAPLTETQQSAFANFLNLIGQRLDASLEEQEIRYDIRGAVLATPFESVIQAANKANVLSAKIETSVVADIVAAANRIGNILRFAQKEKIAIGDGDANIELFADDVETRLWDQYQKISIEYAQAAGAHDWNTALDVLAGLRISVDNFFDGVMVMDDNPEIRDNRLTLLARLRSLYDSYADFDKLVIA